MLEEARQLLQRKCRPIQAHTAVQVVTEDVQSLNPLPTPCTNLQLPVLVASHIPRMPTLRPDTLAKIPTRTGLPLSPTTSDANE